MPFSHPDFPNSYTSPFTITSPQSPRYNCIAYVYGDYTRQYWPAPPLVFKYYWPSHIPRIIHVNSFVALYASIGYQLCANGNFEPALEKIALFGLDDSQPKHAAKQLLDGNWSSKLGENHDVSHSIHNMSAGSYGHVLRYMSRPRII